MIRLLFLFMLFTSTLSAQDTLRIGVAHFPPYTFQDDGGHWNGMAVELWRHVAGEARMIYQMMPYSKDDSLLAALEREEVDLVLAMPISARAEAQVDFTQAFHRSALALALPPTNSLWSVVTGLFTLQFLYIVIGLSALLLIVGSLVYFLERRSNDDQFGGERSLWQGIGSGFWWAGVTMTTIGYGDKAPTSLPGRAVAMLWMLVALAVTSSLTAAIISATNASNVIEFPRELKQKSVGVVKDSPAAEFLQSRKQTFTPFQDVQEGLLALDRDEIEVLVHDATALHHQSRVNPNLRAYVQETDARPEAYAFAVRENSPLYEPINQAVIAITTTSAWRTVVDSYDDGSRSAKSSQ
ncbi:amino acid ABC transporter substrate-binding protein (PAAT family) [Neolewinella xylanilytica]|uniref:Amino acid ABC transporter substrate-binding protein (PAAT family) n=1 Tax=Neolewinella xylanilytica TaxID=1514080 RepID=A0A2S6I4T8_9BACT|nr:transporter substrate-binding domain-containing protein [Neolewinella xylanilytica]PPK86197.1 amino acid ABC transporter substrate-binding protein (PAAT family) [Neolewinella xylanilytica]